MDTTMSAFLSKIWTWLQTSAKWIFGIRDDDALYWNLLFQHKILNGDIGIPIKFFDQEAKNTASLSKLEHALISLITDSEEKIPVDLSFVSGTSKNGADFQELESVLNGNEFPSPNDERAAKSPDKRRDPLRSSPPFRTLNSLFDKSTNMASRDFVSASHNECNLFTTENLATTDNNDFVSRDSEAEDCSSEKIHQEQIPTVSFRRDNSPYFADVLPQSHKYSEVESQTEKRDEATDGSSLSLHEDASLEEMQSCNEPCQEHHATPLKDRLSSGTNAFENVNNCVEADARLTVTPSASTDRVDSFSLKSSQSETSHWSLASSIRAKNINLHNSNTEVEVEAANPSSSVDHILSEIIKDEVATNCPIKGCEVPHCYLSEDHSQIEPRSWFKRFLSRTKERFLSLSLLNVAIFGRAKSVQRAACVGQDLTQLRTKKAEYDIKHGQKNLARHPKDFEEFLENIHFKLPPLGNIRGENPFKQFQNYLGLTSKPFPKNPNEFRTMFNFMAEVRKFFRRLYRSLIRRLCTSEDRPSSHHQGHKGKLGGVTSNQDEPLFLTGDVAYRFYQMLVSVEIGCYTDDLLAEREMLLKHYKWKYDTLNQVIRIARDYYHNPTDSKRHEWKGLKKCLNGDHDSHTDLRFNLSYTAVYQPVFTLLVMAGQVLFLLFAIADKGFAVIGFKPPTRTIAEVYTFSGIHSYTYSEEYNPWLGPTKKSLIRTGKFSKALSCAYSKFPKDRYGKFDIKPCCVGIHGKCVMVSEALCLFLNGIFHDKCDHCALVNCYKEICSLRFLDNPMKEAPTTPWALKEGGWKQKHRIVFSLLSSQGIIILIPVLILEFVLMRSLETYIGWHRVAIIYTISSLAGIMAQLAFQDDQPACGAYGGAMGIFGVLLLEFSQAWKVLPHPFLEFLKLFATLFFFLFLGTFSIINLKGIVIGLVTGVVSGLMAVPYITFSKYLGAWPGRLVVLSFLLLVHIFSTLCIFSFIIHTDSLSKAWENIECIHYGQGMTCTDGELRKFESLHDHEHSST